MFVLTGNWLELTLCNLTLLIVSANISLDYKGLWTHEQKWGQKYLLCHHSEYWCQPRYRWITDFQIFHHEELLENTWADLITGRSAKVLSPCWEMCRMLTNSVDGVHIVKKCIAEFLWIEDARLKHGWPLPLRRKSCQAWRCTIVRLPGVSFPLPCDCLYQCMQNTKAITLWRCATSCLREDDRVTRGNRLQVTISKVLSSSLLWTSKKIVDGSVVFVLSFESTMDGIWLFGVFDLKQAWGYTRCHNFILEGHMGP